MINSSSVKKSFGTLEWLKRLLWAIVYLLVVIAINVSYTLDFGTFGMNFESERALRYIFIISIFGLAPLIMSRHFKSEYASYTFKIEPMRWLVPATFFSILWTCIEILRFKFLGPIFRPTLVPTMNFSSLFDGFISVIRFF